MRIATLIAVILTYSSASAAPLSLACAEGGEWAFNIEVDMEVKTFLPNSHEFEVVRVSRDEMDIKVIDNPGARYKFINHKPYKLIVTSHNGHVFNYTCK
jgi:hypothetical protein